MTMALSGSRCEPGRGEPVAGGVLAQRGDQCLGHALALHAQQADDVDLAEHRVEVVAHRDRPALEARRQQRGRGDEGDLGAEGGEGEDVGAGDPAVLDVADDGDAQPVEPPRRWRIV